MTIVVTGASGVVGRLLVTELHAAGAAVCAITRQGDAAVFPPGVAVAASTQDALPGASALFLNSRALGNDLAAVVAEARRHGVGRLVALSAINVDDDVSRQPSRFIGDRNREVEQLAVASGLAWVSLRPAQFTSALAGMWAAQIQTGDTVSGPYAGASSAPISESDVAAVAARALLSDELAGRRITLTGPRALTNVELLDVVASVLDRPLHYQEVPTEQVHQRFLDRGFPVGFADAYLGMQAATLRAPALVTAEVDAILGRPAVSWRQWVSAHQDLFTAQTGKETA